MAIEIGSLVIRSAFFTQEESGATQERMRDEMERLRREILDEVQDMIADVERRRTDR